MSHDHSAVPDKWTLASQARLLANPSLYCWINPPADRLELEKRFADDNEKWGSPLAALQRCLQHRAFDLAYDWHDNVHDDDYNDPRKRAWNDLKRPKPPMPLPFPLPKKPKRSQLINQTELDKWQTGRGQGTTDWVLFDSRYRFGQPPTNPIRLQWLSVFPPGKPNRYRQLLTDWLTLVVGQLLAVYQSLSLENNWVTYSNLEGASITPTLDYFTYLLGMSVSVPHLSHLQNSY
jgi:hypothetical protein